MYRSISYFERREFSKLNSEKITESDMKYVVDNLKINPRYIHFNTDYSYVDYLTLKIYDPEITLIMDINKIEDEWFYLSYESIETETNERIMKDGCFECDQLGGLVMCIDYLYQLSHDYL